MKEILITGIRWYQKYSLKIAHVPIFVVPPQCKFHPTCSDYAIQTIEHNGVFEGSWKVFWRFLRCNPLSAGGVDLP
jgi:uncharacterized protein